MNETNTPLPYEDSDYRSFYRDEFIAEFNHGPFAQGTTDSEKAREIVKALNQLAAKETTVVTFNQEMITSNQLIGGACSVISLQVAKGAFEIMEELAKRDDLTEEHRGKVLSHRVAHIVNNIHAQGFPRPSNKKSQMDIRTTQQAFNTITVDRAVKVDHIVQEKMKALAIYYDLKISKSTPEIKVKDNPKLRSSLEEQMQTLEEGIYLVRIIDYKENHKLENHGHTITYIKSLKAELYFDPRLGLYQLFAESRKTNLIYNALLSAQLKFNVDYVSFHKLENRMPSPEALLIPFITKNEATAKSMAENAEVQLPANTSMPTNVAQALDCAVQATKVFSDTCNQVSR